MHKHWLLALVLAGCSDGSRPSSLVESVVITSPTDAPNLRTLGRQVQFEAEARDADGAVLSNSRITWSTSSTLGAITPSGLFTAINPGTVRVWAESGRVTSALVTVTIDPVAASVTIAPDSLVFHMTGRPQSLAVTIRDSSGAVLTKSPVLALVDTLVARISTDKIVAVANGTTQLVASADGRADTATVVVYQVPLRINGLPAAITFPSHAPLTLLPVVVDSGFQPIAGYPVSFQSEDTLIASVTGAGRVTPGEEGATTLLVTAGPLTASRPLSVGYVVTAVQILPSPMTIYTVGRPQRAYLYGFDAAGVNLGPLPDSAHGRPQPVSWHAFGSYYSFVPAGIGVDVSGVYNGGDPYDMLNATWNGVFEGYARIDVFLYPATFGILAPQTSFASGSSATWSVVARDSLDNDLVPRATFWWYSNDQSVAQIESQLFAHDVTIHALQPGSTWIIMFGATRMDSVEVTVH